MQIRTTCNKCGNEFIIEIEEYYLRDTSKDVCYDCALESVTGGQPPEEGDFNTARIVSGEMSPEERELLMEDLRSVDAAACERDPLDNPWDCADDEYYDERE